MAIYAELAAIELHNVFDALIGFPADIIKDYFHCYTPFNTNSGRYKAGQ
jgi:hypothetical protein